MATNSLWLEEAQKIAANKKNEVKTEQQYLIEQANANKTAALQSLENNNLSAINKLNEGKTVVDQSAKDNARQANINRLLSLRDNKYAMNRAGLGTQGIVGSQVNSINNNYGSTLNDVLKNKANSLQNIENQITDTNLQYNTNKVNVGNEYDSNIANIRAQIEANALNEYNILVDRYLTQKQQEYANQQVELDRKEQIRQYNEQLAYQKQQAAISNALSRQQLNLQQKQYDFDDDTVNSNVNGLTSSSETRSYNQALKDTIISYTKSSQGQSDFLKNKYVDLIENSLNDKKISNSEAIEMLKMLGINYPNSTIVNVNDLIKKPSSNYNIVDKNKLIIRK